MAEERIFTYGPNRMHNVSALEVARMIDSARAGSADALGNLLEMYRSYLRLIAQIQTGKQLQSKFSPSDVIQGTFMQAQKGFRNFQGSSEGELVAWLRKILANQLAMEVRRYTSEGRNVKLERSMHIEMEQSSKHMHAVLTAREQSPSQSAMRRERAVLLANALAELPEHYREILVLRHFKGHSFAKIAEQTCRSLDSVKSVWTRAIVKLRDTLGDGAFG